MEALLIRNTVSKRVLCFALMLLVLILTFFVQYIEAYAFAPVLPLVGFALIAAAVLLVAAGLTFTSYDSASTAANGWYINLYNDKQNGVAGAAAVFDKFTNFYSDTSQIKIVDDLLWQNVRDYVNSRYVTGVNNVKTSNYKTEVGDYSIMTDVILKTVTALHPSGDVYNFKVDFVQNGSSYTFALYQKGPTNIDYLYAWGGIPCNPSTENLTGLIWRKTGENVYSLNVCYVYNDDGVFQEATWTTMTAPLIEDTVVVEASSVIADTTWDIPTTAGEREVAIPSTLSETIGLTWEDILPDTAEPPDPTIDSSGEINWKPLKVAGILFTNKFPFSLPWDLLRSFTSLTGSYGDPDFSIAVPDTKLLKGFAFNIDLTMFGDLLRVAKALELVAFDIGLIMATRKLLGGGV